MRNQDRSFYGFPFGATGDITSPRDYDGDGAFDAGMFRPSNNVWYIKGSSSETQIVGFGVNGDVPIPSTYVP